MKYIDIFKLLNENEIKYLIVGGLAVNMHGYSRFTADIDVIIDLEDDNILRLITLLLKLGYKPKLPVNPIDFAKKEIREDWIKNKNMKAFNFYNEKELISEFDIVIMEKRDFEKMYKDRIEYDIDGLKIPIINIDDLIKMKELANRSIDKIDVEKLRIIKGIK